MQVIEDVIRHEDILNLTPFENFMFALKSSETKRQYPKLLKIFLDFVNIDPSKSIEERTNLLFEKSNEDRKLLETQIFRYVIYYKNKVENKEIAAGTLKNYLKVIRLFCRMNDI
jgi:CRISPR/Cas system-associated protein Csm6